MRFEILAETLGHCGALVPVCSGVGVQSDFLVVQISDILVIM